MFLFPISKAMRAGTKRLQVRQVWEWSGEALPHDEFLIDQALEPGMGNPGLAFHTQRWRELAFFIRLMRAWRDLPEEDQRRLLGDGWAMAEWIDASSEGGVLNSVMPRIAASRAIV